MLEKHAKIVVLLAVAVSSPAAIFSRLCTVPSIIMAMYRMLFTALILLPMVVWKHREEMKGIGIKNLLLCLLSGFFLGIHFTSYFESMKHTTIAAGTVLADTEVLFVAVALLLLFHEKIPKAGLIGIALTFCGSIIIALGDNSVGAHVLIGDLLALTAAIASSVYTLVGREQRKSISTTLYTFLVYMAACVTLFLLSLFSGQTFTGYAFSDYGWILAMTINQPDWRRCNCISRHFIVFTGKGQCVGTVRQAYRWIEKGRRDDSSCLLNYPKILYSYFSMIAAASSDVRHSCSISLNDSSRSIFTRLKKAFKCILWSTALKQQTNSTGSRSSAPNGTGCFKRIKYIPTRTLPCSTPSCGIAKPLDSTMYGPFSSMLAIIASI